MTARDVVAIVDDEIPLLRTLRRILDPGDTGFAVAVPTDEGLRDVVRDPRLAVVLLDLFIDGSEGVDRVAMLRARRPDVEVVVMTGRPGLESAVRCMRAGAFDYLAKPFADLDVVRRAVAAARERGARRAVGAVAGAGHATGHGPPSDADWRRVPLSGDAPAAADVPLSLEAYERLALERALREAAGDAAEAARRLGIGRSTYYRRAAKLGIDLRRGEAVCRDGSTGTGPVGRGPSIR